jgi:hypothetical protein
MQARTVGPQCRTHSLRSKLNNYRETEKNVGLIKSVPADDMLAARCPHKDFGTSRFKGSYSQAN